MTELLIALLAFIVGLLSFPLVMFLRARRSTEWDSSNMLNIYRVIAHLSTRPGDFGKMQYPDGRRPFHYISKDEISEVVESDYE